MQAVFPTLKQTQFLCRKQGTLTIHESYFLVYIGADPDLNPLLTYYPTRVLLLKIAMNAVDNNGQITDIETAFLDAIRERAYSTDASTHQKQQAFFEMWWSNPDFQVAQLRANHKPRLAAVQRDINSYMKRSSLDKSILRNLEIVAKLIQPTVLPTHSRAMLNPAFRLGFNRGKDERVYMDNQDFEAMMSKFKDSMVYLGRVGEMFDKLGVTEILMDGAM